MRLQVAWEGLSLTRKDGPLLPAGPCTRVMPCLATEDVALGSGRRTDGPTGATTRGGPLLGVGVLSSPPADGISSGKVEATDSAGLAGRLALFPFTSGLLGRGLGVVPYGAVMVAATFRAVEARPATGGASARTVEPVGATKDGAGVSRTGTALGGDAALFRTAVPTSCADGDAGTGRSVAPSRALRGPMCRGVAIAFGAVAAIACVRTGGAVAPYDGRGTTCGDQTVCTVCSPCSPKRRQAATGRHPEAATISSEVVGRRIAKPFGDGPMQMGARGRRRCQTAQATT